MHSSFLQKKLRELERELNETYSIKKDFPEFPIEIKIPRHRIFRDSLCVFYQKRRGFKLWSPNHFTRASLITSITPAIVSNPTDPNIRQNPSLGGPTTWWNVRVGDGVGSTEKGDTSLKAVVSYQADSGTSARVDSVAYQRQFSAIYNAGSLPANYLIREVGLFMQALKTETISGQNFTNATEYLVSRFSTSDGDFTPYSVNNTIPLTINLVYQWTLG